jgi:TMEM175 potassium channel family protein
MTKGRLEAFSDGVIAVIITIMVLELRPPHGVDARSAASLTPVFLAYVLSFVFLGIYWNNHHHLLHAAGQVDGKVLWANLHLLFWLSLTPFATAWMGEQWTAPLPVAFYGAVQFLAAIAYVILQGTLIAAQGADSKIAAAVGSDRKGKLSLVAYLASIPLAWVATWMSIALFVVVALVWLVPDSRIESVLREDHPQGR